MADFYHMSQALLGGGTEIRGDGRNKIEASIENELETRRPAGMLSRRDAVYARPVPDFSRCGIIKAGYIYRVALNGSPERHDLNWLRPMQLAIFKMKHGSAHPVLVKAYPDWSSDLIAKCCSGYWEGAETKSVVWEYLAPSFTVLERLSDRTINVAATRGGWNPTNPG